MKSHKAERVMRAVYRDFLAFPIPALLQRAEFVARYLPEYVADYRPPQGIRLRPDGRPTRTTRGNVTAQITKRAAIINECFAAYTAAHAGQIAFDIKTGVSPAA